jgi:hypothetical protein
VTTKASALVAVPAEVVTLIGPVDAPSGTVAASSVLETRLNPAGTPPNATPVAPPRFVPDTVTRVPGAPVGGANDEIAGGGGAGGGGCGTRW